MSDVNQLILQNEEVALKSVENSIRDLISFVLESKHGSNWIEILKVSPERIDNWKSRMETERKRLKGRALDARLLYYSDFYDLKEIITKHWDLFKDVFEDKKRIEVFLGELEKLRDPNAHRRELYEYQKSLVIGISGEIRMSIMKYRGKKMDVNDYFPKIESVRDSYGTNVSNPCYAQMIINNNPFKVGDSVEITAFSTDPQGDKLQFSIERIGTKNWISTNKKIITFEEKDIGKCCDINVMIRSTRSYYAYSDFDDYVMFRYIVLPR